MRLARVPLGLAMLGALIVLAAPRLQGGALDQGLASQVDLIKNPATPDGDRALARRRIVNAIARGDQATLDKILELGRTAKDHRAMLDVAYILAQTRNGRSIVAPEAKGAVIELATKWLDMPEADAGVRLWAATALANTQDPKVLPILKDKALKPGGDRVIRLAVARALATWRGDTLEKAIVPLLLQLLEDKDWEVRMAGCDILRLTGLNTPQVIEPILAIARGDKDQRVWRVAVAALRRLGGGTLIISGSATDADRKRILQAWENTWRARLKRARREGKG